MGGWREIPFGQLLSQPVRNGIYKQKQFHGRGVKIVNMGELFSYPRLTDVPMKRLELSESEKERFLLCTGDLIFARRSLTAEGAGKCSIIYGITEETTFESSIICARPDFEKSCSLFLYYYFNSPYGKYLLGTILRQVAVAGITGKDLVDLVVKVPLLEEQQAIAAVLSSLDDKIDLLHRQNKTLEALAQTLFRQWFVEEADEEKEQNITDFIDFNPKRKVEKGTIAPYIEMSALSSTSFSPSTCYDREFSSGTKFTNGDTLLARITPCLENGKAAFIQCLQDGETAWGSTEYIVLRPKNFLHPLFAYALAKTADFREYAESCLAGSSGRQRVELQHLMQYSLRMPTPVRIQQFNECMESLQPRLTKNANQIRTLTKLRGTLLPKLMSGEVRVSCN